MSTDDFFSKIQVSNLRSFVTAPLRAMNVASAAMPSTVPKMVGMSMVLLTPQRPCRWSAVGPGLSALAAGAIIGFSRNEAAVSEAIPVD